MTGCRSPLRLFSGGQGTPASGTTKFLSAGQSVRQFIEINLTVKTIKYYTNRIPLFCSLCLWINFDLAFFNILSMFQLQVRLLSISIKVFNIIYKLHTISIFNNNNENKHKEAENDSLTFRQLWKTLNVKRRYLILRFCFLDNESHFEHTATVCDHCNLWQKQVLKYLWYYHARLFTISEYR